MRLWTFKHKIVGEVECILKMEMVDIKQLWFLESSG